MKDNDKFLGKYGIMHYEYIKENAIIFYENKLLADELEDYLQKVNDLAKEYIEKLIDKNITENPVKINDPLQKALYMTNLKESLEEIVYQEYVYKVHREL